MKFTQLKKSLEEENMPVYYLYGDDRYLIQRSIEFIKQKFVIEPSLDFTAFDIKTHGGWDRLISELTSYPFMSPKRVVLAEALSISEKDFKEYLEGYIKNPCDTTIFIITEGEQPIKKPDLKRLKGVTAVDCNRSDKQTVEKWVYRQFKQAGVSAETEAIELLCDYTLCSMTRLVNETAKLIDYADGNRVIDIAAVQKLVAKDSEYQLYELTNEIANGNIKKALLIADELKQKGFQEFILFSRIFSYFKNLFHISVSVSSDAALADIFKVKEYAVKMMRLQSKKFSKKRLKNILLELAAIDAGVKSGKIGASDAFFMTQFNLIFKK